MKINSNEMRAISNHMEDEAIAAEEELERIINNQLIAQNYNDFSQDTTPRDVPIPATVINQISN